MFNIILDRHVDPYEGAVSATHGDGVPDEQQLVQVLVGIDAPAAMVPPEKELLVFAIPHEIIVDRHPGRIVIF